ncbi:MAG: betaine/proline/choline family ABC transporter ATP-binding protein [Actinobacteria bacterium]|nr:betaine/proline/choline family ABC transporter ATP-binding protein [Actinomycetota bacterium]
MIRLESVTKRFPGTSAPAVDGLSLEVPEGEIVVLVGPSGCGKTTTLKMINRLVEPTSGTIHVAGEEIRSVEAHELRRRIGYVIQQIGLFPHRTIRDNIATVPRLLGWDEARIDERVDELIQVMSLDASMRDRYPAELSGGQRQRVGVARALAADPPVLLMDEPFGAVDPIVRSRLQRELLDLQQRVRKTIVFVTHDIDEAIQLGDRIAILNVGGILEQYGSPREVLADPANAFVEDFLGSERGLKRLSLIPVTELDLDRGPVVDADASIEDAKRVLSEHGSAWVGVLEGRRMRGWVWGQDLEPGRRVGEHETHDFLVWIESSSSLREALDAVVNTRNQVAVVYDEDVYLGMLRVEQISRELLR